MDSPRIAVLALALLFAPLVVFAQVGNSSLSGTVTDPSGAVIPNATITLNSAEQTFTRTAKTGTGGDYVLPSLPPGRYRVKALADGFVVQETEPFELSSGQAGALNVTLRLASQASQVTVEAAAPQLQTTSASLGSTVTQRQVNDLPILGRSFLNAVSLVPGTVPVVPAGSTTNHSPVNQSTMPSVFGQSKRTAIT